jgi:hypothetical protein
VLAYGFGEHKTPKSFIAACDKFIFTEDIQRTSAQASAKPAKPVAVHPHKLKELLPTLTHAVKSCADQAGWSSLGPVGQCLANSVPDFDPRHYGFRTLSSLVNATGLCEVEKRGNKQAPQVFVRSKAGNTVAKRARVNS